LGNALSVLRRRESGAAKLEEAVAAYREARKEQTRGRVPLHWARSFGKAANEPNHAPYRFVLQTWFWGRLGDREVGFLGRRYCPK
jgi:hypothetical protein